MLTISGNGCDVYMEPGKFCTFSDHEVAVGRHLPPSAGRVEAFITYFEQRYRFEALGSGSRILAIAAAHHRFNYIHPFLDGNGRVRRLMSHAMAVTMNIGPLVLTNSGLPRCL